MTRFMGSLITTIAAFSLTACGGTSDSGSGTDTRGAAKTEMAEMQRDAHPAEHSAEGTINSVDQTADTVNISHGPVASANWPGMTMNFKLADSKMADGLKQGQRVKFQFTIQGGMDATVTRITSME